MRVIVCGGRTFGNYSTSRRGSVEWKKADAERTFIFDTLDKFKPAISCVIEGAARGADTVAGEWAIANGKDLKEFPADWAIHGPSAGYLRNKKMLHEGNPDLVIAFPGGKGTANMVNQAKKAGVPVKEIPYE